MQELIHIGNFQERSKIITGHSAKLFIDGQEIASLSNFSYSIDDISIDPNGMISTIENFNPKEIAEQLSKDIEKNLYGENSCLIGVIDEDCKSLTIEDLEEAAMKCAENFGQANEMLMSLGLFEALKIDMNSIKTEIVGNEIHVDMNLIMPSSIDFILTDISMDNIKTKLPGGDLLPQEVKCSNPIIHVGNFEDFL